MTRLDTNTIDEAERPLAPNELNVRLYVGDTLIKMTRDEAIWNAVLSKLVQPLATGR